MANYYETLGVGKTASETEIKSAYRKLALKYHPDRNAGDKKAEDKFKEISEAYAVLSDKDKRKKYDTFGDRGFHQQYSSEDIFRGTDFSSIFNEFGFGGAGGNGAAGFENFFASIFGNAGARYGGGFDPRAGYGGHAGYGRAERGQDVEYPLDIGFMDAYNGGERKISFQLSDGTRRDLTIKVPKGVKSGTKLRVAGRGAPSMSGGPEGDLYVVIKVAEHPLYQRVGDDIETPLNLKITEALLGTSTEVETPQGKKRIKVPEGVGPGTKIRLKGLGFANGDLYAVVHLEMPKKLTKKQLSVVESMQEVGL